MISKENYLKKKQTNLNNKEKWTKIDIILNKKEKGYLRDSL